MCMHCCTSLSFSVLTLQPRASDQILYYWKSSFEQRIPESADQLLLEVQEEARRGTDIFNTSTEVVEPLSVWHLKKKNFSKHIFFITRPLTHQYNLLYSCDLLFYCFAFILCVYGTYLYFLLKRRFMVAVSKYMKVLEKRM